MKTDGNIADDTKAQLLAEVGKTALGRHLLDFLETRGIAVVLSTDVPQGHAANSIAAAVWDPRNNRIVINPDEPPATLMHFFAHEVRHAAQSEAIRKHPNAIELMHPLNNVLLLRLQEMDADVFAVHFLANHALYAENNPEQTQLFVRNMQPPPASRTVMTDEGLRTQTNIDRSGMYRAYAESWGGDTARNDSAKAMQAALRSIADNGLITQLYGENALGNWNKMYAELLQQHRDEPHSNFAKAFRKAAARFVNNKAAPLHETFAATAQLFGGLFSGAGVPDYFAGIDFKRMTDYLIDESPSGRTAFASQAYQDQLEFFRKAAQYYLEKAPEKAARNKQKPAPAAA